MTEVPTININVEFTVGSVVVLYHTFSVSQYWWNTRTPQQKERVIEEYTLDHIHQELDIRSWSQVEE